MLLVFNNLRTGLHICNPNQNKKNCNKNWYLLKNWRLWYHMVKSIDHRPGRSESDISKILFLVDGLVVTLLWTKACSYNTNRYRKRHIKSKYVYRIESKTQEQIQQKCKEKWKFMFILKVEQISVMDWVMVVTCPPVGPDWGLCIHTPSVTENPIPGPIFHAPNLWCPLTYRARPQPQPNLSVVSQSTTSCINAGK